MHSPKFIKINNTLVNMAFIVNIEQHVLAGNGRGGKLTYMAGQYTYRLDLTESEYQSLIGKLDIMYI